MGDGKAFTDMMEERNDPASHPASSVYIPHEAKESASFIVHELGEDAHGTNVTAIQLAGLERLFDL